MLGTLKAALEVRQVPIGPGDVTAVAEGDNEVRNGLPVLTRIVVHYTMRIPPDSRDRVDRALARHQEKCPTAESLKGAIAVSWTAEINPA